MSKNRTRSSKSARLLQIYSLIDEYESATGDTSGDMTKVAKWLYANNKIQVPKYDVIKQITRILTGASRQDYVLNDRKEPVRRRHAYPTEGSNGQTTFAWFKIEKATPEMMRLSAQSRRNGTVMDLLQLVRDVDFYNDNYNPGDPIEIDKNFTSDIEEARLPTEYPEEPPTDQSDE